MYNIPNIFGKVLTVADFRIVHFVIIFSHFLVSLIFHYSTQNVYLFACFTWLHWWKKNNNAGRKKPDKITVTKQINKKWYNEKKNTSHHE